MPNRIAAALAAAVALVVVAACAAMAGLGVAGSEQGAAAAVLEERAGRGSMLPVPSPRPSSPVEGWRPGTVGGWRPGTVRSGAPTPPPPPAAPDAAPAPEAGVVPLPGEAAQPPIEPVPGPQPPAPAPQPPAAAPDAEAPRVALAEAGEQLAPFSGLSTWIDLYDTSLAPEEQVALAADAGVQALFVQSARFNSPTDVHDPVRLAATIETAHDRGLEVMVWYIPDFLDPERDLRRAQAAMAFTTPRGDRPDAFGLDIEAQALPDVAERSRRVVDLSARLRSWSQGAIPMAAIALPPLQLDLTDTVWPDFPWAELRPHYDVVVPMSYSSYRGTDAETTHRWNLANVEEVRRRTGDPDVPVHLAGGIANRFPEVAAFTRAVGDAGVLGGGLYDLHTTHPEAWRYLRAMRREQ